MRIFMISPVRLANRKIRKSLEEIAQISENMGNTVYLPCRDVGTEDNYLACCKNRDEMEKAETVFIVPHAGSKGIIFDLGMAFGMGKEIKKIDIDGHGKIYALSIASIIEEVLGYDESLNI